MKKIQNEAAEYWAYVTVAETLSYENCYANAIIN